MEAAEFARLMEIKHDQRRASLKLAGAKRVRTDKNGCTFGTFGDVQVMVNDVTEPKGLVNVETTDGGKFLGFSALGLMEQLGSFGYDHGDIDHIRWFARYHRATWSPKHGEFFDVTTADYRSNREAVSA